MFVSIAKNGMYKLALSKGIYQSMKMLVLAFIFSFAAIPVLAGPLQDAAKSGDTKMVSQLLDEGANIDEADKFGTALHWASMNGHLDIIELLMTRGANPEMVTDFLGTPLHSAVLRGQDKAAKALIELGAKVDSRNSDGFTPLMVAAGGNRPEIVRVLIDGGADVDIVVDAPSTNSGNRYYGEVTALHIAYYGKQTEIAQMLRKAGAGPLPIASAASELADADPNRGHEAAGSWCAACHRVDPNAEMTERDAQFAGPTLVGVYRRPVASIDGFNYSAALKNFGGVWDDDRLYAYVTRPMLTVPGTRMTWHDGWSNEEVADIIAYFREQAK